MRVEHNTKAKSWITFTCFMLIVAFMYMFAASGYAEYIHFNVILTYLFGALIIWKAITIKQIRVSTLAFVIVGLLMFVFVMLHFQKVEQLMNFTTLFCGGIFISFFSSLRWSEKRLTAVGVGGILMSWVMLLWLLPGGIWSGWNTNSSAVVVPIFMWSCCCLLNTSKHWKYWISILGFGVTFYFLFALENRSGIVTLALFALLIITNGGVKKLLPFRIIYAVILVINIGFPYLRNQMSSNKLIDTLLEFFAGYMDKGVGFNGREQLWEKAIQMISKAPIWGTAGIRSAYYHNFSLEVLIQFGCVGLIYFLVFFISNLEEGFRENSASNYFLSATVCMLFLNTFENLFLCNNYFMFFPYVMLGTAFAVQKSNGIMKYNMN